MANVAVAVLPPEAPEGFEITKYFGPDREVVGEPKQYDDKTDICFKFKERDFEPAKGEPRPKAVFLMEKKDKPTAEQERIRKSVTGYVRDLYGKNETGTVKHNYLLAIR
jgi:hypothetical protein